MVLGARLRTVMSSIIRWRKAEILPAGGTEYAEGLLLLMRGTVMENPVERHVGDSGNQVGVTTRRSWQPNATRRVSPLTHTRRFCRDRASSRHAAHDRGVPLTSNSPRQQQHGSRLNPACSIPASVQDYVR